MSRAYKYGRASMQSLRSTDKMYECLPKEEWILESQAKFYCYTLSGSPGFLSLSNQRIVFEPAVTSLVHPRMIEIKLNEIDLVKKTRHLFVFPNSFLIWR